MVEETQKNAFNKLLDEGQALYNEKKYKAAIKQYKIALIMYGKKLTSFQAGTLYIRLANAYYNLNDRDMYTYYYKEYLKEFPQGQTSVFSRLAHAYYYIDSDISIDYDNKALDLEINKYNISCKLFAMTKSASYSQQDIKDESEFEIDLLRNTSYKNIKKYTHLKKKNLSIDKKLNIAYLSSDCYAHTMMNYILPIWENHDKENFNFCIFNCADKEDATTEKIKATGIEIISCHNMNEEELAKAIFDKDIDILVDLGGYTHLRSFVSLYKPAPVIISYLGYLNTMGIKEVDYILADKFTIPEEYQYLYTEKPLYLDTGYQIFTEKKLPEIENCPFEKNGYITYGSFNCSSKINDADIYMWAEILKRNPESELLIYRTKLMKQVIKNLKLKFEKLGINTDRILFDSMPQNPHFKAYSFADIALDTFPFSGMSIAIETALMGVPTITLLSEGIQSRGAGRINHLLNLDEFNTNSGEDYVEMAVELAKNKEKLIELRRKLRSAVENSQLRTLHKEFTKDLECKYKKAWKEFINNP